jgi:arylformamidase
VSNPWIDVSVTLRAGMVHWPGDTPFSRGSNLSLAKGDECNLSQMTASCHTGTHMDAPLHFVEGGAAIDAIPLEAVIGPARVIAIEDPDSIGVAELQKHNIAAGERVLFRTRNSDIVSKSDEFQEEFVHIPHDAARYLASLRVLTIGVDYLSVGGYQTDGAETHRALLGAGIWIIEGLNLAGVAPGDYDLVCLPLKLAGADGAPARAALRKR